MGDGMLYAAFLVSVFGLLLVTFISPSIQPPLSSVSDVSSASLETVVRLEGNASKTHRFRGGSMVFVLSGGGSSVDVYLPYAAASELGNVSFDGRFVEVTGTIQVYEGRLEVVADRPGAVRAR